MSTTKETTTIKIPLLKLSAIAARDTSKGNITVIQLQGSPPPEESATLLEMLGRSLTVRLLRCPTAGWTCRCNATARPLFEPKPAPTRSTSEVAEDKAMSADEFEAWLKEDIKPEPTGETPGEETEGAGVFVVAAGSGARQP